MLGVDDDLAVVLHRFSARTPQGRALYDLQAGGCGSVRAPLCRLSGTWPATASRSSEHRVRLIRGLARPATEGAAAAHCQRRQSDAYGVTVGDSATLRGTPDGACKPRPGGPHRRGDHRGASRQANDNR